MGACCSKQAGRSASPRGPAAGIKSALKHRKERKRQLLEALAAEAKTNELLSRIPGRIFRNGVSRSACIFTQQGRKGTNQDAMIAWEDFMACADTLFCGVFDGHGPYGHLVARKVRDSLPSKLASIWKAKMRGDNFTQEEEAPNNHGLLMDFKWADSLEFDQAAMNDKGSHPIDKVSDADDAEEAMYEKWRESFMEAFEAMDMALRQHPSIDCFCSGTTAVVILKQGQDLVIGNVGDSRAVLATRSSKAEKQKGHELDAVQLTVDLKPSLPKEEERILKCKGRVFALEDEPEVARVWLPYDDAPGLAMARAFGDFCLKDFGLISVPEVTYRKLTPDDQFVVLATDGIWDVLSNKEVVDVIQGAPTRATAARALVETAVRAWRLKYPNSKVDDCAVVCIYLQPPPNANAEKSISSHEATASQSEGGHEEVATDKLSQGRAAESCASFERSNTVRAMNDADVPLSNPNEQKQKVEIDGHLEAAGSADRTHSVRSIGDCLSAAEDEEWSALEGVVRVNSLLHLPRFLKGDKRANPIKSIA